MGKSTQCLSCLSVLAVINMAIKQSSVVPQGRIERDEQSVKKLLDPKGDFLSGEDTPVWLAYRPTPSSKLSYKRLEKGIVKKAIDYWKSDDFKGIRRARSVDSSAERVDRYATERKVAQEIINETSSNSGDRVKREWRTVYHPSLLVLMSYQTDWPAEEKDQQKLVMERILYALAFWNGVDLQLRALDDPRVRLRIAGIVIGQNKEVTNRLYDYQTTWHLDYQGTLHPMIEYWDDVMRKEHNDQFNKNAYNVVATMSDSNPSWHNAASTDGPPCNYKYDASLGGLIFQDDLAFDGLQTAVLMMSRVLGQGTDGGAICQWKSKWANRWWDKCDLKMISNTLRSRGWCMGEPKEYHPPGKPVEAILPGKLMPASKQCQARGWSDGNVCWKDVTCEYLYCSNDSWASPCKNSGAPVDGTTCGQGKMCLNTECVSNTTLSYT